MNFKNNKSSGRSTSSRVLALLGVVSLASIGYMGFEAFDANKQSSLDLNSLPSDNAKEWERIAKVDQVLTTLGSHYAAVISNFRGLSDATSDHHESLIGLFGGIVDGEEILFESQTQSPKAVMGKIMAVQKQNTRATRESAQSVNPENIGKALLFVRSQREFLERADIDISEDLDTLSKSNLQFKHISLELGAQGHAVYQQCASTERLINYMQKNKSKQAQLAKLFDLTFKKLISMLQAQVKGVGDMKKRLTQINIEMNEAILRLENSSGIAMSFYQKRIEDAELDMGRAQLKVKQLIQQYEQKTKETILEEERNVIKPIDPRQMIYYCNEKEIVKQTKVMRDETSTSGFWIFAKSHTKKVFSHMDITYRNCRKERSAYKQKNQEIWARRQQNYAEDKFHAEQEYKKVKEQWRKDQMKELKMIREMQYKQEDRAYVQKMKMTQTIEKQTLFSQYMQVIITYQEGIMGSQQTILYICYKFNESIKASLQILKDTHSIMGGSQEEQLVNLSMFDMEDGEDEMDDIWGSKDELSGELDKIGSKAEGENIDLYLQVIKGDIIDIKVQSYCTEKSVGREVKIWRHQDDPSYNPGDIPSICTKLEGQTKASSKPDIAECNEEEDPFCGGFI